MLNVLGQINLQNNARAEIFIKMIPDLIFCLLFYIPSFPGIKFTNINLSSTLPCYLGFFISLFLFPLFLFLSSHYLFFHLFILILTGESLNDFHFCIFLHFYDFHYGIRWTMYVVLNFLICLSFSTYQLFLQLEILI
jgi:hypothetical protein